MKSPSNAGTAERRTIDLGYGRTSRQYELPTGELFDSVTSILGIIAKPALITWAANQERLHVSLAAADLYEDAPGEPKMSRQAFLTSLDGRLGKTKAHQKLLNKASEIGSQVHALIEWNILRALGRSVGPEPLVTGPALCSFASYETWRSEAALEPLAIEQVVWSRLHRYAGTLDLFAELEHPQGGRVKAVIDWKTGKGIYPEASLQSAAYVTALLEMKHAEGPVWGLIVRLPKTEGDPGFEVLWISPEERMANLEAFLAAKRLWDWQVAR